MPSTASTIFRAVLLAGTLDVLSAFVFSGMDGVDPLRVMRGVASGPFGDGMRDGGLAASLLGFVVHYSIMTVMVSVFFLMAKRITWLTEHWALAGIGYGFALYLVMYWIVLPLRWPAFFPKTALWPVANALFSHVICVGIPLAFVISRSLGRSARSA